MAYTLPHSALVCVYHPVVLLTEEKNQTARQHNYIYLVLISAPRSTTKGHLQSTILLKHTQKDYIRYLFNYILAV
jgi:hypothetical protein